MRRKFELDFKLRIVRRYFEDIIGIDALSSETSIDRSLIRKWVKFYELYGVSGLARTRNSYYPVSFKLKVIKFVAQGMSIKEAARKFNIAAESSIIKWQRDYEKSGNLGLENKPRGRPKTMSNYKRKKRKTNNPNAHFSDDEDTNDDTDDLLSWTPLQEIIDAAPTLECQG